MKRKKTRDLAILPYLILSTVWCSMCHVYLEIIRDYFRGRPFRRDESQVVIRIPKYSTFIFT